MNPLVSVIMPIYGTERYLESAMRSALEQTCQDIELILLNDSSPGNPLSIVRRFKDERIRYLEHENGGPSFTRNRGILESRGRYVAFLDSDDEWLPNKLERQLAVMDDEPTVDVVYSQRLTIDEKGNPVTGYAPRLFSGNILNELYVDNFVCMSSSLLRREVFRKVGFLDESLRMSEDFDFWLRVACDHRFLAIEEPLVRYRVHSEQVSGQTDYRVRTVWEIRERFDREFGSLVSWKARRRAKALHYSRKAYRREGTGERSLMILMGYLQALIQWPLDGFSYRGLARQLLPAAGVGLVRRIVRKGRKAA